MCGYVGYFEKNNYNVNEKVFIEIINTLYSRGPDNIGYQKYSLPNGNLNFGHRRLSILDLTSKANQPMLSEEKRYSIIYNGEIYNHVNLRKNADLVKKNNWRGTGDTETLLRLFEIYSFEKVLEIIDGMFSFALFDHKKNLLFLARDRSGEKPLYISTNSDFLAFSSDLKAFKKFPNFNNELNKNSLNKFLNYNYIPSPETIYKGIFKLPQGSFIKIDLNNYKLERHMNFKDLINSNDIEYKKWWSIKDFYNKKSTQITEKTNYIDLINNNLLNSVNQQLISDVPLGVFLSGGIDSTLITCLMKKINPNTNSFSIGFEFSNYDESKYAENIANYLGINHNSYICNKNDALNIIDELHLAFSEPFADSSMIPTMLLSKMAKNDVKVCLTGDGGDEIFGGYNRYIIAKKYWKYLKFIPKNFMKYFLSSPNFIKHNLIKFFISISSVNNLKLHDINNKSQKILDKLKIIDNKYLFYKSLTTEWTNHDEINNFEIESENDFIENNFVNYNKLSYEEQMMQSDFESYLPDDILCKVDRSSMHYSLETRAPFLGKDVIESAYLMPSKYKIYGFNTKWILREILKKHIPKDFYERPKQGFGIPISIWMKNELKDWTNDLLSREICNKHNLFNFNIVDKLKSDHFSGFRNNENKLWSLIQFNQWYLNNIS